jgi:ferulate-5-hydroxylase
VFVVSTAEYAGQVLQAQDAAFANRPATTAIAYLTDGHADMAFAQYGPFWRQARKLSVTKLFSRRRAETWLAVRDESEALVRAVARRSGETVNLGELVLSLSTNVIFRAAFGTRVNISLGEYIGVLEEFSRNISAFNIGDFMPWLAWIDPSRRRLRETRKGFDRFIDKIIDDHIRRGRSSTDAEADIIDEMLACLHETKPIAGDAVDDRHGSLCLTRRNIKAVILVRARIVCRASISDPAFILLEMNFTYVLMCHVCMDRTTSHARRISCLVGRRRWRRPSSGR